MATDRISSEQLRVRHGFQPIAAQVLLVLLVAVMHPMKVATDKEGYLDAFSRAPILEKTIVFVYRFDSKPKLSNPG